MPVLRKTLAGSQAHLNSCTQSVGPSQECTADPKKLVVLRSAVFPKNCFAPGPRLHPAKPTYENPGKSWFGIQAQTSFFYEKIHIAPD
jgi:hypothetical protein